MFDGPATAAGSGGATAAATEPLIPPLEVAEARAAVEPINVAATALFGGAAADEVEKEEEEKEEEEKEEEKEEEEEKKAEEAGPARYWRVTYDVVASVENAPRPSLPAHCSNSLTLWRFVVLGCCRRCGRSLPKKLQRLASVSKGRWSRWRRSRASGFACRWMHAAIACSPPGLLHSTALFFPSSFRFVFVSLLCALTP